MPPSSPEPVNLFPSPMPKIRLIADENVPIKLVNMLRDKGCDVHTQPKRTSDIEIGKAAQKESRAILTQDTDFTNTVIFPPKNFHGIIRLKFNPPIIANMRKALDELFSQYDQKDLTKKLIIVEEKGFSVIP